MSSSSNIATRVLGDSNTLPRASWQTSECVLFDHCVRAHSLAHSLTHSGASTVPHSLTHLAHSLTHSLARSLTRSADRDSTGTTQDTASLRLLQLFSESRPAVQPRSNETTSTGDLITKPVSKAQTDRLYNLL